MAKTDEEAVISDSPDLEFTIAPDELALLDEDFTIEEESANFEIEEKTEKGIQHESTDKKSHEKDAFLNVPTTTASEIFDVAENSQKKIFVPITFEPFKHTEKSEDSSLPGSNYNCLNTESLSPPGEECTFVQMTPMLASQQPEHVAKPHNEISAELLPPGESSESKSSCIEKLEPICLVTPAATRKVQAPAFNNYVGPRAYQPPAINNFVQQYCGPSPMDYAAHFTPFGTFSEPCFFPQPPLYCPPPMYSEPMLMCAVPEPVPQPQPYNPGPYGTSAYSSMYTATPQHNSFVSAVDTHVMPPALPQHIVSHNPPSIPPPIMLTSCPPPVSMITAIPPPVSMSSLSTASLLSVSSNSLPYAVTTVTASVETAPSRYSVEGKEKECEESRFIVSFSNIYRFIHQAEFRKLISVCGSLKHFKYQPPAVGGDAHGTAEACFTNRQSALRAKRLLSALTIGGAQITTSSPTHLVDTISLSDPEKTKDVECMVAITNLLQSAARVFNWDNYQYRQKSSSIAVPIKPENRPFPESKPVLLKPKEERGCGRNNLITIRLGANIQTKLATPPPAINNQLPPVSSIQLPPVSSIQMPPVSSIQMPPVSSIQMHSVTATTNSCPPLGSIGAWVYSLNCPQSIDPPQPVPPPVLPPQNNSNNVNQQSSSTSWPVACKRSDNGKAAVGDKPSNKTILASIETINKQISERKERINKQLEKLYTETNRIRKRDEFCVRVEGLYKSAAQDLQRSCNAAQHFIGSEAMFLLGDSDRACLLQQLLHRHRLLDARVRAELLNCQASAVNISTTMKMQYIKSVQQALTLHEEEARKSLVEDLDQVVDVYKYKMKKCSTPRCSDPGCLYFHNASDYRRDPLIFNYRPEFCPERPQCKESVRCGMCHTEAELQVHPEVYLSEVCRDWTDDDTGCPHQPGNCFKAHPKCPEMLFHPEWRDLYVKGLRNTFLFLAGAVRNLHRVDTGAADKVRVLALFPCEGLVESAMQLLAPTAQRHLVRVAAVTNKNAVHQEASVLLGTVSALVALMRHKGCLPFSDLRVLVVDDLPSIIEEPKMLDDFVCFVSLLYTTLAKSGRQQSLLRVVVAQEVTDEEVVAARTLLSTNFLLATRSYASKEVPSSKPHSDVAPVLQSLESYKDEHQETIERSKIDPSPYYRKRDENNETTSRQDRTRDENNEGTIRHYRNRDENNEVTSQQDRKKDENNEGTIRQYRNRDENNEATSQQDRKRDENNEGKSRQYRNRDENNEVTSRQDRKRDENNEGTIRPFQMRDDNNEGPSRQDRKIEENNEGTSRQYQNRDEINEATSQQDRKRDGNNERTSQQYRNSNDNNEETNQQDRMRDENNEGTSRQKEERSARDEFQRPNEGDNAIDSTPRISDEKNDNTCRSSQQSDYDGSRNYGRRHEAKNVPQQNQIESLRDKREADSRERSMDTYRRHDDKDNYSYATRRLERNNSRDRGRQTNDTDSSKDKTHRQELGDEPEHSSRGSSADKTTKHNRGDRKSKDDERRYDQEQSTSTQSGRRERKYSSPECYKSVISLDTASDELPSNSGIKRKSEEQFTERKTWRIKLSSVTVNPAKKKKDEEGSAGGSAEAARRNSISDRSDSDQTNYKYLGEEWKLRKDHDEEYDVFKDMPEMHPDYEEIMEEFTKLYPAGDEDRRWKMFWNIKLETIRENAWEEKKKDLFEKHKAANLQRNKPRLSADPKQSFFDMDDSQLESEKFCVTDAYDSLDDQTNEMGVLGPPLRRLLRQARSAGGNTVSALTLFTNPDNATLIRMCVDRLRKLLPTAPQSKVLVLRRTAVLADSLLTHAKKAICKLEETRRKLLDLDLIVVAKATLGQGPSEIIKYIKSNLGNECNEYISNEEFNEVFVSVSSMHVKMIQDCRDLFNVPPAATSTASVLSVPSAIKESEIPLCLPAAPSKRPLAPQPQPETSRPEPKASSDPWFVAEVRTIMDMPGVSVEIFNRSLCDIFSRKPPAYKFTKKDLSLANDLKQLTGFNLTESMFLFALKKILSELEDEC